MSKLIITEKPSVAKSIASALGASSRADGFYEGSGLIVSWCVGHLVSPLDAGGYDERFKKWRYEDLPILPEPFRYAPIPGKEAALDNVKRLMAREDVTEIVNACDAGREGELIFRLVYEMTGCRKPVLRLWISSMEDSAIREGFSELRPGADYEALYQSALCRQRADWLVGINATRLFSVLYHRTLNVGRVQTPTLSLLAARDAKIALFQKEKYGECGQGRYPRRSRAKRAWYARHPRRHHRKAGVSRICGAQGQEPDPHENRYQPCHGPAGAADLSHADGGMGTEIDGDRKGRR